MMSREKAMLNLLSGESEIKSHRSPSMGAGGDTGSRHQVSESRRDTPDHAISRAQVVPLWEKSATGCKVTATCTPITSTRVQSMLLPVLGPCLGTVKRIPSRGPGKTHIGISALWNVPWLPHHSQSAASSRTRPSAVPVTLWGFSCDFRFLSGRHIHQPTTDGGTLSVTDDLGQILKGQHFKKLVTFQGPFISCTLRTWKPRTSESSHFSTSAQNCCCSSSILSLQSPHRDS
ncbi:uncharacterized protein LOC117795961 isoform X2 [Ailuropoda melanoleuca]|uniref:uncharacterized protein LOC117795961 isoform X2 n=1 Tax=Ailuropoda melanoleuca TaxID=9646 RepID=UPI001493EBBA|nr:uncharacterized protein LOC117795961 isoform X2 [Ailuropoda melanoleuca]